MKVSKRVLSLALALALALTLVPMAALAVEPAPNAGTETAAEALAREKIEALKSQYPEGMSWTNDNSYYCKALRYTGYGCAGFAYICSDAVFGDAPVTETHSSFDKIRVGDVLRINNDTHSVVALRKLADSVIVAEGNFNRSIHWGREISRADLEKGGLEVTTRWTAKALAETPAEPETPPVEPENPPAKPEDPPAGPEIPVAPEAPVETPIVSATYTASPTNDKLTVDGAAAAPTAYKINGSNYFKLRDMAALLNGSAKEFDVGYDDATKSVTITTGEGYAKLTSDLQPTPDGARTAMPSNNAVYIDGVKVELTVYKINGSNYFKLRDLGQKLDFYVGWEAGRGMFIETDKSYDPAS